MKNLTQTHSLVSPETRQRLLAQKGAVLWFTGLSGSGKSTLVYALEERLLSLGQLAYVLDGDNVRMGLCQDLGFSPEDRRENIRRVGHVAGLFADAGLLVLTSFISPYRDDRALARKAAERFVLIHLDVPLAVCESRDPKGLYQKAYAGEIEQFTGVHAPYEPPTDADITLTTNTQGVTECVDLIVDFLRAKQYIDDATKEEAP